jgi:hypothetical protein
MLLLIQWCLHSSSSFGSEAALLMLTFSATLFFSRFLKLSMLLSDSQFYTFPHKLITPIIFSLTLLLDVKGEMQV